MRNPLAGFSDLAGKNGVLTCHQKTHFHKTYALRAAAFISRWANGEGTDIRSLPDNESQELITHNRLALLPISETLLFCAHQKYYSSWASR